MESLQCIKGDRELYGSCQCNALGNNDVGGHMGINERNMTFAWAWGSGWGNQITLIQATTICQLDSSDSLLTWLHTSSLALLTMGIREGSCDEHWVLCLSDGIYT